jgi:hypothetical protein
MHSIRGYSIIAISKLMDSDLGFYKVWLVFCWEDRQLTETELEPRVGHDKSTGRREAGRAARAGRDH